MAFNENINFWTNQTVASGESMSAPLEKLLENDNYLKNKSDENEPKVFFAEYEITTFEEVTNALAANKMVFLRKIIITKVAVSEPSISANQSPHSALRGAKAYICKSSIAPP